MNKPRNRSKPRPTRKAARLSAERAASQANPKDGQASCPSSAPPANPQQTDLLLRLWERGEFALSDIAAALRIPMPDLIALLQRPDIAALLDQMGNLLDLRLKHIAAKAAPKALATLEQVQTEAEQAATSTPVSPQAIKADRRAASARAQRRLSASAILTMHRFLKVALRVAPLSDQMLDRGGMAMQRMAMQDAANPPLQQCA
jgi:hypothetical protein